MSIPFAPFAQRPSLLGFIAALTLAGCDSGTSRSAGSGGNAGVSSGAAGSAGAAEPFVFEPGSPCVSPEPTELPECSQNLYAPLVLAAASDILEGGRIVAIGGGAALVEGEGEGLERYRVILIRRPAHGDDDEELGSPVLVRSLRWDDAAGDVSVVGVLGFPYGLELPALDTADGVKVAATALACDAKGCTLLAAATEDDEELVPIDAAPLPAGLRPVGFTGDQWQLCAHTDSELYCNDGEDWYLAVQPEPPSFFRQVLIEGPLGMALTEDGRLWVRRVGTWEQEIPGFDGAVARVNVSDSGALAMGSAGELAINTDSDSANWQHLCTDAAPATWASVGFTSVPSIGFAVTADGAAVRLEPLPYPPPSPSIPAWCVEGRVDISGIIGPGSAPCRDWSNWVLATATELIALGGELACAIQ